MSEGGESVEVSTSDLASFLGEEPADLDEDRAALLLEGAAALVEAEVGTVPAKAKPLVLTVAARAYVNPGMSTQESAGPFASTPSPGGLYLTKSERRLCRLYAGKRGGAYTIDPTPVDAWPGVPTRWAPNLPPELLP